MLLTPQQKESCKAVKIELNEVIKKSEAICSREIILPIRLLTATSPRKNPLCDGTVGFVCRISWKSVFLSGKTLFALRWYNRKVGVDSAGNVCYKSGVVC